MRSVNINRYLPSNNGTVLGIPFGQTTPQPTLQPPRPIGTESPFGSLHLGLSGFTNSSWNPFQGATNATATGTIGTETTGTGTIMRILAYFMAIAVVLLIILLFVHYFITPVFKLQPGAPGILPVPGFDDGLLFWNKSSPHTIVNNVLPIKAMSYGYSMILDVFLQNPLQFSSRPRILWARGAVIPETISGTSVFEILGNYNLAIALDPNTNDLSVNVLTSTNETKQAILHNITVQEPFRLGIIILQNAMEIYVNGQLMKTITYSSPPKDVTGDITIATGIQSTIAKFRNLKIWAKILTANEIRYAAPDLSTIDEMGAGDIPASSSCPSFLS